MGLFFFVRPDVLHYVLSDPLEIRATYRRDIVSPRLIGAYLRSSKVRKLQIGAGNDNYPGWLNTDIDPSDQQAYLDASKRFPLPDATFQYVFAEHIIEHLTYEEGLGMLKECHRVLAPGGKVRIATPNLMMFIGLFQDPPAGKSQWYEARKRAWHEWPQTPDSACYFLNSELRWWGHQFVYTPKMLRAGLENAGFCDIREFKAGESDDPALGGLEARYPWEFREAKAYETMVLQAVRK